MSVVKPTAKEVWNWEDSEHLTEVSCELLDTWRHGTIHQLVVEDTRTNDLWAVDYRTDKDGDYNDVREGDNDEVYAVTAVQRVSISYERAREPR